jgi:alkylation response protein AidB-like acyl-CoA dehydrogenase
MDAATVHDEVRRIADRFAADRHERQRRERLVPEEFDELAAAGFLLTGVPRADGGLFESAAESTRAVGSVLNALARGDASVALVASMHPAVLSFWHASPEAPPEHQEAWSEQRAYVSRMAADGSWFGTITSEPGSGGDVARTAAAAEATQDGWRISGKKHFGSGSGVTSFMLTSARAAGEEEPDWFLLDVRDVPWDGSRGMTLLAPWEGHGMTATQSHGMKFDGFAATRFAWPGSWRTLADAAGPFVATTFTAVILGVVEAAIETARGQLAGRGVDSLRPYEQVEWVNAEQDAWLMRQAYEGMLRAVETQPKPLPEVLLGKTAAARLAEDCLRRLTRIMGGGTFARHSPFGFWFEDVRALGYLRPPWGLAYDALINATLGSAGPD